jgi:hypothetical protein
MTPPLMFTTDDVSPIWSSGNPLHREWPGSSGKLSVARVAKKPIIGPAELPSMPRPVRVRSQVGSHLLWWEWKGATRVYGIVTDYGY